VSVVLFGSIARGEVTSASDADWSLLVDGQADPEHPKVAQEVGKRIRDVVGKEPGREGVFGSLAFSHDLIQLIGGKDDTNQNLTRRNLLLLESRPFGNADAYNRTVKQVFHRYVHEDLSPEKREREFYVPRFLLNDFARFWRTMAVDFAYKRRRRSSQLKAADVAKAVVCIGAHRLLCVRIGTMRERLSFPTMSRRRSLSELSLAVLRKPAAGELGTGVPPVSQR
jgi:hypothetical protein